MKRHSADQIYQPTLIVIHDMVECHSSVFKSLRSNHPKDIQPPIVRNYRDWTSEIIISKNLKPLSSSKSLFKFYIQDISEKTFFKTYSL